MLVKKRKMVLVRQRKVQRVEKKSLIDLFNNMHHKILYLSILLTFLFGCQAGKYVTGFKDIKKDIDTLVIMPVNVNVSTVDFYYKKDYDYPLEEKIENHITTRATEILKNKYFILTDTVKCEIDSLLNEDFNGLITMMDTIENPLSDIKMPASFGKCIKTGNNNNRYFLMLFLNGQYCIDNNPYKIPGREVIYLDEIINTYIKGYVVMFDNLENKLLYYREVSSKDDPRSPELVERITSKTLQTIYYK